MSTSAYREFTGKSVEEALRIAREDFGVGLDDLDFEILTPGSRGVLGMGAEPAASLRRRGPSSVAPLEAGGGRPATAAAATAAEDRDEDRGRGSTATAVASGIVDPVETTGAVASAIADRAVRAVASTATAAASATVARAATIAPSGRHSVRIAAITPRRSVAMRRRVCR